MDSLCFKRRKKKKGIIVIDIGNPSINVCTKQGQTVHSSENYEIMQRYYWQKDGQADRVSEWVSELVCEWVRKWGNDWVTERVSEGQLIS